MALRRLFRVSLGVLVGAFLLLSWLWGTSAQGMAPVVSVLQVDDAKFPAMEVIVSAADASGHTIPGLTKDAFLVVEDGNPVDISSVQEMTRGVPLYIALAIDTSGSMKGEPLEATRQAVETLVGQLTPQDRISLITFGTDVETAVPLTVSHRSVVTALQNIRLTKYTRLYDGAYQAVRLLQNVPPGRRAVVLMTDGQDTKSTLTLEDVVQDAQKLAVPIYIIGYGKRIEANVLQRIAQRTGGAFLQAPSTDEIPKAFSQVFDILRRAYKIRYISNLTADGKEHELRVTLTAGGASAEVVSRFIAHRGNFHVQVGLAGLPDQEAAKHVWNMMGKKALSKSIPFVSGQVQVYPKISGPGRTLWVQYMVNGTVLKKLTRKPFTYTWQTKSLRPDVYTLSLIAQDHVGNKSAAQQQVAVVPPVYINILSPASGATVTGSVPISVTLISVERIKDIRLKVDGRELGHPQLKNVIPAGAEAKVNFTWNTQRLPKGHHDLRVYVTTEAGQVFSSTRKVNVGKHILVVLKEPKPQATLEGDVRFVASIASDAPIKVVHFFVDDQEVATDRAAPFEAHIHTGDFTRGTHKVRVVAENVAGQVSEVTVPVTMIPAARSGAAFLALIVFGFLVLLGIPMAFWGLRRRRGRASLTGEFSEPLLSEGVVSRRGHQPAGWLVVKQGDLPQRQYQLYEGDNRIGRNREFADIWVPDMSVSRQQAIITIRGGEVVLKNLSSHNPTIVNGQRVSDTAVLRNGDEVQMGRVIFTLQL